MQLADVVVTAGGAGTVLAAHIAGVPMVITPLGADHALNAATAEAAGSAVSAHTGEEIEAAVRRILADDRFRARATHIANEIAKIPESDPALAKLLEYLKLTGSESVPSIRPSIRRLPTT